jgi:hypothetical protein
VNAGDAFGARSCVCMVVCIVYDNRRIVRRQAAGYESDPCVELQHCIVAKDSEQMKIVD